MNKEDDLKKPLNNHKLLYEEGFKKCQEYERKRILEIIDYHINYILDEFVLYGIKEINTDIVLNRFEKIKEQINEKNDNTNNTK